MRRMKTPVERLEGAGIPYFKQKDLPSDAKPTLGTKTMGANDSPIRKIAREAFWRLKMNSFVSTHLKDADKVWLLNDTAFPEKDCGLFENQTNSFLPDARGNPFSITL